MGYQHVQRLLVIAGDYAAVRQAVVRSLQDTGFPDYALLSRAEGGLETAYIARLFSEFEGILRPYLQENDPRRRPVPKNIFNTINRTASIWRVPDPIRDAAQEARQYRNSVVHPDGTTRAAISFSDTRSILSKFLARLP